VPETLDPTKAEAVIAAVEEAVQDGVLEMGNVPEIEVWIEAPRDQVRNMGPPKKVRTINCDHNWVVVGEKGGGLTDESERCTKCGFYRG